MIKTYYIIRHEDRDGSVNWKAYRRSPFTFGYKLRFLFLAVGVDETYTSVNADKCEELLRKEIIRPRVVRTIKIP